MVVDGMHEVELTHFGQLQGIVDCAAKNRRCVQGVGVDFVSLTVYCSDAYVHHIHTPHTLAVDSVAATDMNAQSSRSHCCFVLHIIGTNAKRNTRVRGCLNLVDLAGSERLARSGATGARAKETAAINKSLSALVDVFDALAKKRAHVPYRNSKLTYLMQSCLSGHGKTMMIVNVSPTTASGGETLCSLRFARQVNQTELGKAKKQVSSSSRSSAPPAPASKRSRLQAPGHGTHKRQRN